jgi:hypothetical protein
LKAKLDSLGFSGNLDEESTIRGPLQQEIVAAEGDMQSFREEIRRKDTLFRACSAIPQLKKRLKRTAPGRLARLYLKS